MCIGEPRICANLSTGFSWQLLSIRTKDAPQFSAGWAILHCVPDIRNATLWGCSLSLAETFHFCFSRWLSWWGFRQPTAFCGLWFQLAESPQGLNRLSLLGTRKLEGSDSPLPLSACGTSNYGLFPAPPSLYLLSQSTHSWSVHPSQAS